MTTKTPFKLYLKDSDGERDVLVGSKCLEESRKK